MFKLFLVIFISVLMNVQTYKYKPRLKQPQSSSHGDWFYEMGDDWGVSNKLAKVNPYYNWYKQAAAKMDAYAPALHVGKIDRGQFYNPELNMPSDRAFGYQSDFNPEDFDSGAFNIKPQGQKIRAKDVHVDEGLASYVGELVTLAPGQYLQDDGSMLIQTSFPNGDPCQPNPCTNVRMSTCTPVNRYTAKCTRTDPYKLTLSWFDPNGMDSDDADLNLLLVPDYHDGTLCTDLIDSGYDYLEYWDGTGDNIGDCGALFSENDYANYDLTPNYAEETATLTTLADGTNYKHYTYAVIAKVDDIYNLSEGGPTLTVETNGVVKQTLTIPQYVLGGPNLNYGANPNPGQGGWRQFYFFGCFRPQLGYVDTRGAGFYDDGTETAVTDGLGIFSPGLCRATLSWSSGYGFMPYDQSGSGDEAGSGS